MFKVKKPFAFLATPHKEGFKLELSQKKKPLQNNVTKQSAKTWNNHQIVKVYKKPETDLKQNSD